MKKITKLVCILMCIAMVASLCACGSSSDKQEAQNALEKIKADGVLTVALSPDYAPMEFVDASKSGQEQYVGFDVMLAKYIADYIGVDLTIDAMGFDACQTAVYTATVPISISGWSWTEERAENYNLSDYYYAGDNETEQVILVRAADTEKYKTPADFAGLDVGAQVASLQMQLLTDQLPDANPITSAPAFSSFKTAISRLWSLQRAMRK